MRLLRPTLMLATLIVTACRSDTWAPMNRAGEYRQQMARLKSCVGASVTRWQRRGCVGESRAGCVDAGLEPNCAEDKFEEGLRE